MANEIDQPPRSSAGGRPDDDLPTSQIPAMKGAALAAAQAQADIQRTTPPGDTTPRVRVAKPAEPAGTEDTLVHARLQAAVVVASTPPAETAAPRPVPVSVPPKAIEPHPAAAPTPTAAPRPLTQAFTTAPRPVAPLAPAEPGPTIRPIAPAPLVESVHPQNIPERTYTAPPVQFATPYTPAQPVKPAVSSAPPNKPSSPRPSSSRRVPRRRHRVLAGFLVALLVLALSGATGVAMAANRYGGQAKLGTTIAGTPVTGQTQDELTATIQQLTSDLNLTVSVEGKQHTFSMKDLGVTVDTAKTIADVLDTDGRFSWWPFRFKDFPLELTYTKDAVQQAVANTMFGDDQKALDATIELDESTSTFMSVSGHDGTTVDASPVSDALTKLADGKTVDTIQLATTVLPAGIQDSAADAAAATANNMVSQKYSFSSDKKSYTLKASEVAPWVSFTADSKQGLIGVAVDATSVSDQLPDILNSHVASPPVDKRVLYSPEGNQIAVESWGQSGTVVSNTDAAVAAMQEAMTSATPLKFTLTTKSQSFSTQKITVGGAYDKPNGSKWIDVNQKTFKVTLYKGTTFVKQFTCVTGAPATPSSNGTFYISRKFTAVTMVGRNSNGTSYVSPNVPWTSFYHNGEALHGAPWRSSFGYRASHGCINLPVSAAKFIYDWAPLGTRVVVHW